MNLASLTLKMMLNTSRGWLDDQTLRDALTATGPLGAGVLGELAGAHTFLVEISKRRQATHERLRELIDLITELDRTHDRKARGLYNALGALIDVADSEEEIERYQELLATLFPIGLRVIRLPFIEESGAAEQLAHAVQAELRAQLAALKLGTRTLEQIFDEWIAAGRALGRAVNERTTLQASLKRKGSAANTIDVAAGRNNWISAVRGLLWALGRKPALRPLLEPIEAVLRDSITIAQRRRAERRKAVARAKAVEGQESTADASELGEQGDESGAEAGELEEQADSGDGADVDVGVELVPDPQE